jgi:Tn3 transposase DDE domain
MSNAGAKSAAPRTNSSPSSKEADDVVAHLCREFDQTARRAEQGMSKNPFASVRDGRLKLHGRDALDASPQVAALRRLIEASLARVRIEDLLREVDSYCHFTREFRPLGGYEARSESVYPSLLAAVIARHCRHGSERTRRHHRHVAALLRGGFCARTR